MSANFTPERGDFKDLTPFRYWCQKVLPLVYDDSLSYYEVLNKTITYLNDALEDVSTLNDDVTALYTAYDELQAWVNAYYESTDFEEAIDAGIDRLVEDGTMQGWVNTRVAQLINTVVASQIGAVVANQIGGVVGEQIGGVVANQLTAVVNQQIGVPVNTWLNANMSSATNALDNTFELFNAAPISGNVKNLVEKIIADCYVTGKFKDIGADGKEKETATYTFTLTTDSPNSIDETVEYINAPDKIIMGVASGNGTRVFPEYIPVTRNIYPTVSGRPGVFSENRSEYAIDGFSNVKVGDKLKFTAVLEYNYNPNDLDNYVQGSEIPANNIDLYMVTINNLNAIVYTKVGTFPMNAHFVPNSDNTLIEKRLESSLDYTVPEINYNENIIGFIIQFGSHQDIAGNRIPSCAVSYGYVGSTSNQYSESLTLNIFAKKLVLDEGELLPEKPSENGVYELVCTVQNGEATYEWVSRLI